MLSIITFSTWLTCIRIFLAPCVVVAIYGKLWIIACILFILAGVTDFFDGYYARLYQQETELGKILDPVADKILIFSTLLALHAFSEHSLIPSWFLFLVACKEFILILGAFYLLSHKQYKVMSPSFFSKLVTVFFMLFLMYLMLIDYGIVSSWCVCASLRFFTIATIVILLDYSYKFYQRLG